MFRKLWHERMEAALSLPSLRPESVPMQGRILGCILAVASSDGCRPLPDAAEVKGKIARKIWQNGCSGTVRGLVSWNRGEAFPSLGIGHLFGSRPESGRSFEKVPPFVEFCRKRRGPTCLKWCYGSAPWKTREELYQGGCPGGLPDRMRQWLSSSASKCRRILSSTVLWRPWTASGTSPAAPVKWRPGTMSRGVGAQWHVCLDRLRQFQKGEGTNPTEQYCGQGWGLRQVLEKCARLGQPAAVGLRKQPRRGASTAGGQQPSRQGQGLAGWPDGRTAVWHLQKGL